MPESMTEDYLGTPVVDGAVQADWIDFNQHMNVAYYVLAFDIAVDSLWERFGITENNINVTSSSTFAVESHITWQREMAENARYVITTQVLAYDDKRIHQFMRMYHADKHYLAATAEWLNLHVDLSVRRVCPWPPAILERIAQFSKQQQPAPWPVEAGKQMLIKTPLYAHSGAGQ